MQALDGAEALVVRSDAHEGGAAVALAASNERAQEGGTGGVAQLCGDGAARKHREDSRHLLASEPDTVTEPA